MPINDREVVVTLDPRRILGISLLAIITISTVYSYSVALFGFMGPYQGDEPLKVHLELFDLYGANPSSFKQGSEIIAKVRVEMPTAYYDEIKDSDYMYSYYDYRDYGYKDYGYKDYGYKDYGYKDYGSPGYTLFTEDLSFIVFVTIMDSNDMPVYYSRRLVTLNPGELHSLERSFIVPDDAALGEYSVSVIVWTEPLPAGIKLASLTLEKISVTSQGGYDTR